MTKKCQWCRKECADNCKFCSPEHEALLKTYHQSDKFKAYQKAYRQSDKFKAYQKAYRQSDKFKAYRQSDKFKAYRQSDKYKASLKALNERLRGKTLERKQARLIQKGLKPLSDEYQSLMTKPTLRQHEKIRLRVIAEMLGRDTEEWENQLRM